MKHAATAICVLVGSAAATTIGLSWGPPQQPVTAGQPQIVGVDSAVFIETKVSGERIAHPLIHARIRMPEQSDIAGLTTFASELFLSRMRAEAENSSKDMIWITFYFADDPGKIAGKVKTYREIFVREATTWYRLHQGGKQII